MEKIDDKLKENLRKTFESAIEDYSMDAFKKKLNDAFCDIEMDLQYDLKERMTSNLSYTVIEMAEKAVTAILEGNEGQLRRYLSCDPYGYTGRASPHSVIHGTLFESGPIKIRKDIVDAYPELLKTERILDLESQVESLVKQVNQEKFKFENYVRNNQFGK